MDEPRVPLLVRLQVCRHRMTVWALLRGEGLVLGLLHGACPAVRPSRAHAAAMSQDIVDHLVVLRFQHPKRGDTRPASVAESSSTATPVAAPGAVESIAATVPADIRATRRLVIGVNVPYPSNEFKDTSGQLVSPGAFGVLSGPFRTTIGQCPHPPHDGNRCASDSWN
jgi:hypothetical protein